MQNVGYNTINTGRESVRIVNTYGLDKQYTATYGVAYIMPVASEGTSTATGFSVQLGRGFKALNAQALGKQAAEEAVSMLHASPVPSGQYRVILHHRAMADLLSVFDAAFSAENVQKDLSILKGKLGRDDRRGMRDADGRFPAAATASLPARSTPKACPAARTP